MTGGLCAINFDHCDPTMKVVDEADHRALWEVDHSSDHSFGPGVLL